MLNDYAWQQLHAQREREHRARARRRGGDDVPTGAARPAEGAHWLRLRAGQRTVAAAAWARLASGHGSLAPAGPTASTASTASTGSERERDAA